LLDGYRFANGFQPRKAKRNDDTALSAVFVIKGFQARADQAAIRIFKVDFEMRYIPHAKKEAAYDQDLPDLTGRDVSEEYKENGRHLAENIDYYRRERIVDQAFRYGEVAALARTLKNAGVNLVQLARTLDPAIGAQDSAAQGRR